MKGFDQKKVYIIRCWLPDQPKGCQCDKLNENICSRGFFSLFLQALRGVHHAYKNKIPCYIDFGNSRLSLYSDPQNMNGNPNFWDYFFSQPFGLSYADLQGKTLIKDNIYETWPDTVWEEEFIREDYKLFSRFIKLQPRVTDILQPYQQEFTQVNYIGIHVRRTDHKREYTLKRKFEAKRKNLVEKDYYAQPSLAVYKTEIRKAFDKGKAEKLFIATDDQASLDYFVNIFGEEKVTYINATRSKDAVAVHRSRHLNNSFRLGLEAVTDCYLLSLCKKLVLTHSNFSYAALVFNPPKEYIVL